MKLLITTQVVDRNDPDLGFFHSWIEEFAKHCERVEVICLYEGEHALPANVRVHSLGKNIRPASSLVYAFRFKRLMAKLRHDYDEVFVHMNPEYVVLGGIQWHLWHKKVGLWYLHKSVDLKLRLAVLLSDVVFTASKESFRLRSKKVRIVGHGIAFDASTPSESIPSEKSGLRMVTVGRVSPAKKVDVLLDAYEIIMHGIDSTFDIIGTAGRPEEKIYEAGLIQRSAGSAFKSSVHFLGPKTHAEVGALLPQYDLFLHASTGTGSVDKAVLEALLSGVPVISTSPAFRELLSPYGLFVEEQKEKEKTAEGIAAAITTFVNKDESQKETIRQTLREKVVRDYSLSSLIPRLLTLLAAPGTKVDSA